MSSGCCWGGRAAAGIFLRIFLTSNCSGGLEAAQSGADTVLCWRDSLALGGVGRVTGPSPLCSAQVLELSCTGRRVTQHYVGWAK